MPTPAPTAHPATDDDVDPAAESTRLFRVLAIVAAGATVAWVAVLLLWDDAPAAFTFDDAYYYFGIARNLATGHGSSFDGINPTNGYHPLWLLVAAVPYALGANGAGAARGLLGLQLVVGWGATLVILARIAATTLGGWAGVRRPDPAATAAARRAATATLAVVFALVAVNPFMVKVFVNGLETGLSVTLLAILLLIGAGTRADRGWLAPRGHGWRLGVGALLALTFLARTDSVLLIGTLGLWCLAEWWRGGRTRDRTVGLVELFGPPAMVIGAYLVANQVWFGTAFQVSGLVKRAELTPTVLATFALFLAGAAFVGVRAFRSAHRGRSRRGARFEHAGAFAARTGWFGAFCVLVLGYYTVLQTQIWLWYFAPVVLYALALFLLAIGDMVEIALRDGRADRSPARLLAPVQVLFVVLLGAALVVQGQVFRDPDQLSLQLADRDLGLWIRDNLPDSADTRVASWDAGAVGYFADRPVVNLDGLVNSRAYYDAMRNGTAAAFLRCERIRYVANHGGGADGEDPSIRQLISDVYGPAAGAAATVRYRRPFIYSGTMTGSAGSDSGPREVTAFVYEVPADAVARAAADPACS